ncbi:MAG TPA: HD domain-containing phosphohydrolase [Bdellovibrionales bacterium]|nr:HD domain-containing phosphohydrolase [Bdellovibrionales bacterium]
MNRPVEDSQVQPIPIEEFLSRPQVLVDIFIRLSQNKFILIAKGGQNTPREALEKYKAKNIDVLYIRIEDYHKLLLTTIQNAAAVLGENKLSAASRFNVIHGALEAVYKEMKDVGFDEQTFSHAKLVNHATLSFVKESPNIMSIIEKFANLKSDELGHALMVSMVSVMIGIKHEWEKPATLEKLGLGGFLHDIGKTKLPTEVLKKRFDMMNRDEKTIYVSHVEVGVQTLAQAKSIPEDVLLIVAQHHERVDGSGFPKGIKEFQISPLAKVVSLANAFVDRLLEEKHPHSPQSALRVFQDLQMHCAGQYNRDAMKALSKCLEITEGKMSA